MRVWRICKAIYAGRSFLGEGGLIAPARWHHSGHRIVYTAQSLALAALETWVHVEPAKPLPTYITIFAEIPDDLVVHMIEEPSLPRDWRRAEPQPALRNIGTEWLVSRRTTVARVPATTVPGEFSYLLNPEHRDFARIYQGEAQPFRFDRRMWKVSEPRAESS